jgi:hypothetical protein
VTAIARAAAFAVAALLAASLAPARPAAAAPVPLEVCAEDRDWLRPSEDEMARTVWRDNRYREPDGRPIAQALAYHRAHFVVFAVVTGSGVAHALDMTGLMPTRPHGLCEARTDAGLRAGRTLVVWALGYHPTASDLAGATVTVTVEPNATPAHGYAAVEVPRPPTARWTARFVLPDGREVGRVLAGSGVALADEPGPGTAGRLPSGAACPEARSCPRPPWAPRSPASAWRCAPPADDPGRPPTGAWAAVLCAAVWLLLRLGRRGQERRIPAAAVLAQGCTMLRSTAATGAACVGIGATATAGTGCGCGPSVVAASALCRRIPSGRPAHR